MAFGFSEVLVPSVTLALFITAVTLPVPSPCQPVLHTFATFFGLDCVCVLVPTLFAVISARCREPRIANIVFSFAGMFLLVPSYLISFVTALYALFAIPTVLECSEIVLLPDFRPTMSIDLRHFFVVAYAIVVFKAFAPLSHFLYSLGRSRLLSRMQRPINASDSDHVALTLPDEAPPPPLRVLNFNLNEGVGVDGDNQLSALFQSIICSEADVVAIQGARSVSSHALASLQSVAKFQYFHRGPSGIVLFSRLMILEHHNIAFESVGMTHCFGRRRSGTAARQLVMLRNSLQPLQAVESSDSQFSIHDDDNESESESLALDFETASRRRAADPVSSAPIPATAAVMIDPNQRAAAAIKVFSEQYGPVWIVSAQFGDDSFLVEQSAEAIELLNFIDTKLRPHRPASGQRARSSSSAIENICPALHALLLRCVRHLNSVRDERDEDTTYPSAADLSKLGLEPPSMFARFCASIDRYFAPAPLDPPIVFERPRPAAHVPDDNHEPCPIIVCGDLHAPPDSAPLQTLKVAFDDAFGEAGVGWGGTGQMFPSIFQSSWWTRLSAALPSTMAKLPLRLDHILLDFPRSPSVLFGSHWSVFTAILRQLGRAGRPDSSNKYDAESGFAAISLHTVDVLHVPVAVRQPVLASFGPANP